MKIADRIEFSIKINGSPYPVQSIPGLQASICCNVKQHIPTMMLVIPDFSAKLHSTNMIADGTKIEILLTDSHGNKIYTPFRSFGVPKRSLMNESPGYMSYLITGMLDTSTVVHACPNAAFTGTSSNVFAQIASGTGLNYSQNISTNDSMTWMPAKKTWAAFADYVCAHAWKDEKSFLSWAVDESKNLLYVNVPDLYGQNVDIKAYFYFGAPVSVNNPQITKNNTYYVWDYKANNNSGLFNHLGAYGVRTSQTQLNGTVNKYLDSSATVYDNQLDIGLDIYNQVQKVSRMRLPPIDTGNAHPNYIQALHQNHRLSCTYSQTVHLMVNQQTGLTLYDKVLFTANGISNDTNKLVNGTYLVSAISRSCYSGFYWEKIELTTNGPLSSNAGLVS